MVVFTSRTIRLGLPLCMYKADEEKPQSLAIQHYRVQTQNWVLWAALMFSQKIPMHALLHSQQPVSQ